MTNEEIQSIFFAECEEALAAAEAGLNACLEGERDLDTVNSVFRAVHSIKGGAGAFGHVELQAFTHGFETLLSDVREGVLPISDGLMNLMLRALDLLSDHVDAARGDGAVPHDRQMLADLAAAQAGVAKATACEVMETVSASPPEIPSFDLDFDLDAMLTQLETGEEGAGADAGVGAWKLTLKPNAGALDNGGEPVLLLRELALLGGRCVAAQTSDIPEIDAYDSNAAYLGWSFELSGSVERSAIEELFDFVGEDCPFTLTRAGAESDAAASITEPASAAALKPELAAAAAQTTPALAPTAHAMPTEAVPSRAAPAAAAAAAQSVRIDLPKLDRLIDNVGELVIAQAMLAQRLSQHGLAGVEELAMIDGLTREIQESAMAIRAMPIRTVFSRVPRMLRELESETGKRVKLEVSGEATELDKTVVERLGEPLTHLIRNAVDHGLEKPEDRVAVGKPAEGVLTLSAEQRSGRILIKITDDGRGIDRARVFAKAVERGLVAPEAALSDEEIDHLIFAAGFSTAESISNISGRGVGMDVVRQNVKDLGGRISIESRPGAGCTFTLALPLTLAISDGMIVTVGDQTLVLPLAHVVESLRPQAHELSGFGADRLLLNARGRYLPILPLDQAIDARGAKASPLDGVLIIVDTESAGQAALQVDAICDQRQFVIKSLDTHYRLVEGVAGATILGDGRVALIADVDTLVGAAVTQRSTLKEAA